MRYVRIVAGIIGARPMPISFACGCGKALRAGDELAGKRTKCPECGSILTIPKPEIDLSLDDGLPYGLDEPDPAPKPESSSNLDDEFAVRPSTYHATPSPTRREDEWPRPSKSRPTSKPETYRPEQSGSGSSIREYAYLLLVFALVPLIISHFVGDGETAFKDRLLQTMEKASPEEQERLIQALQSDNKDQLWAALPGGKLEGAHLSHDSMLHWVYAGLATVGFLLFILLFFSVERANPLHLLGIGLFTGTIGILLLLAVQFCTQFRFLRIGRGIVAIVFLILMFIGWSYQSAEDPNSNFFLSAFGFTFGVGLCEELCKALPLFVYFKRYATMGWRGACLWGLASGIGFGVSEGIMYSSNTYNGMLCVDIYFVRFISCVALHAMWAGSVGIAIARNLDSYEAIEDAGGFGLFMLRVLAVPMLLHGFYDTLLKKDMGLWALGVALLSFVWLAVQIELARGAQPEAGNGRKPGKRYSY